MSNKKLELIYGCMFSGKTSKLIEIYNNLKDNNNCLAVNYILDKRYSNEDTIVSHNKVSINCYCCKDLQSFKKSSSERVLDDPPVYGCKKIIFFPLASIDLLCSMVTKGLSLSLTV